MAQLGIGLPVLVLVWFVIDTARFAMRMVRDKVPFPGYLAATRLYFQARWFR